MRDLAGVKLEVGDKVAFATKKGNSAVLGIRYVAKLSMHKVWLSKDKGGRPYEVKHKNCLKLQEV